MEKPIGILIGGKHFVNNDETLEKLENLGLSDEITRKIMNIFHDFVDKGLKIDKEKG